MRRWLVVVVALLLLLSAGCHRAEILENVPAPSGLSHYRTAGLVFARGDGKSDDAMDEIHDEFKDRIEGTNLFASVVDGPTGELVVRIVLLRTGEEMAIGIDLLDARRNALVGRFEVHAKSSKGIRSAAREVARYLEEHR